MVLALSCLLAAVFPSAAAPVSLASAPPVVVKTEPVAGATEVDPNLTELRVTFSKPMDGHNWTWRQHERFDYPEMTGDPKRSADKRTFVRAMRLKPGKSYGIWFSREGDSNGLVDIYGHPAVPYLLTFTTAAPGATSSQPPGEVIAQAVKAILQCAEGDPRVAEALAKLKALPQAQAVAALVPFLDSSEDNLRRSAVYILWQGKFDDIAPAVAPLHKLLSHEEFLTRGMAALALGQNRVASSFDALADMTAKDTSPYARRCAAYALGLLGDQRAKPILEKALQDAEKQVRNNAQYALDLLGNAKTPEEEVRAAARQFAAAISERDDKRVKALSCDAAVKGWVGAVSHFADELRAHLTESGAGFEPLQKIEEVLIEGDWAAVKTAHLPKPRAYLVLFFAKTPEGWRNCSLRNSPESKLLSEHLERLKAEVQKNRDRQDAASPPSLAGGSKSTLADWLREEDIALDKVSLQDAPYTQIMIEDVQPDGNSRFRSVFRNIVKDQPQKEIRFVNSDFVELQRMVDADGNAIPFTATHRERRFHYTATLANPAAPGSLLLYGSEGIARNKVDETQPGIFSYRFTHYPGANVPTRRVEVHRLPVGAELLEVSEKGASRVRNGRTEIVLDEIVPTGGSIALNYRYQLKPPPNAENQRETAYHADLQFMQLLNDNQRKVLAWTDRQFRGFFDQRTFDGWSEKERADLEKRLLDTLNGPLNRDYYTAINSLAALRSTNALPKLRELAFNREDKDCRDRWMAVRALGILGDKASIPDLIHLVYHGNTNTRWWAQISLVRLTGQNFGSDWTAWGKWWNDQNGQPPYKPEIIRWWKGQAEPDKLAETLAENDRKFLEKLP